MEAGIKNRAEEKQLQVKRDMGKIKALKIKKTKTA